MLRQHAVEPLSGIGFAGPYRRGAGRSRHFKTLAGLGPAVRFEGNWLSPTIHRQPKIPLAGLDPAIYVFLGFGDPGGRDVDARNKSGQGVLTVVLEISDSILHCPTCATGHRGLGPAIHVFKPADRKGRPNQDYLGGSGELSRTRPVLYVHLTLFCRKNICVVLGINQST
jgi:hypothetical protein